MNPLSPAPMFLVLARSHSRAIAQRVDFMGSVFVGQAAQHKEEEPQGRTLTGSLSVNGGWCPPPLGVGSSCLVGKPKHRCSLSSGAPQDTGPEHSSNLRVMASPCFPRGGADPLL